MTHCDGWQKCRSLKVEFHTFVNVKLSFCLLCRNNNKDLAPVTEDKDKYLRMHYHLCDLISLVFFAIHSHKMWLVFCYLQLRSPCLVSWYQTKYSWLMQNKSPSSYFLSQPFTSSFFTLWDKHQLVDQVQHSTNLMAIKLWTTSVPGLTCHSNKLLYKPA